MAQDKATTDKQIYSIFFVETPESEFCFSPAERDDLGCVFIRTFRNFNENSHGVRCGTNLKLFELLF